MGAVTGAWEEVGRLEWEVGHSCGRSDRGPEALLPTHPLPLLSKQNSTLQTLTFSLSDFTNLPFSTLKLSHFNSLLFCCIQSLLGPSPALLRTWPRTKGLFSEQQGVLFLLSAPQATPPSLLTFRTLPSLYQHFHFLVNSLSCIVSCFFILNFSFALSGTFAFKFYPHHGKLLKMGLIMELKSLQMIDWETILRNIGHNSISISSHISMLIL